MAEHPATGRGGAGRKVIGTPFRRIDARAKVTGETRYADDLSFPRMVHACLTRSTVPHARILSVDCSAAEAMPGVLAVITGKDLPNRYGIMPVSRDETALAVDRVRHVGEPVAAVAALTEDQAQAAALAVDVEYEALTTISSVEDALATPEPRIHDYGVLGNIHRFASLCFGDVEAGFDEADLILEDLFFYDGSTHLPLEQHAAVALPDGDDRVIVYASTQVPHYVHIALAAVLQLPPARIRVIACPSGGGFGGKTDPFQHEIVVAKLALDLGRPVKCALNREEVFYCHRGRHPVQMRLKTGFRSDGSMTSQHLESALDGGAYGSYGAASLLYTGALQTVTYELPRYRFDGVRAFTNKPPCGPKRGHGTPQPRFALEVQLDKAAERLGIDPADLRLQNLVSSDSVTANWLQLGTVGLGRAIEAVVAGSGWRERYGKLPEGRGLGLACSSYLTGAGLPINWNHMPQSGAVVQLDRSGSVAVLCGQTEIGQGSDSVMAAIAAEVLGVQLADVRVFGADTGLTPVDIGSYSSRVTLMAGNAVLEAAERVREQLAGAVAEELEVPAQRLVFAAGRVFDSADPERGMSFAHAVVEAETRYGTLAMPGSYTPPRAPGRYRGSGVGPSPTYSYSAAVIEVEVEPATGQYRVDHVWVAHDVGTAINPVLVLGQIEGSVYMGLGEAMMEEQVFRRLTPRLSNALVHRHPTMLEYKSPTFHEMPGVTSYIIEDPDPKGPFGAKEAGQGPLLPVMPAVANAIFDAVGVRIDQVPIHPHMIAKALAAKALGKPARFGPIAFPEFDAGPPLFIPTPQEGGDGRSLDDPRSVSALRTDGTMSSRAEALARRKLASSARV